MPGFMDKLKQAAGDVAEATKKGAATAQTKAKAHGLRGKADEAAQRLGYLVHRERTGGEGAGAEAEELLTQITDLQAQIAELEAAPEGTGPSGSEADTGGSDTGGSDTETKE